MSPSIIATVTITLSVISYSFLSASQTFFTCFNEMLGTLEVALSQTGHFHEWSYHEIINAVNFFAHIGWLEVLQGGRPLWPCDHALRNLLVGVADTQKYPIKILALWMMISASERLTNEKRQPTSNSRPLTFVFTLQYMHVSLYHKTLSGQLVSSVGRKYWQKQGFCLSDGRNVDENVCKFVTKNCTNEVAAILLLFCSL
jgi:hypothetical protein